MYINNTLRLKRLCLLAGLFFFASTVFFGISPVKAAIKTDATRVATATTEAEGLLFKSVEAIQQRKPDEALRYLDELLKKYPNYRLAHLIRGDLLMAKTKPISGLGGGRFSVEQIKAFREEAIARINRLNTYRPSESVPWLIWSLPADVRYAFLVETTQSRLYVFRNQDGVISYVTDFYVSIGKLGFGKTKEGDQKTPLGVYFITSTLAKNQLKDFYGSGAFPLNYPNDWDVREGRTGSGIWLHGVPSDTFSRPPKASDGCVVLSNQDFNIISQYVDVGRTPVVVTAKLAWVHPKILIKERQQLTDAIEAFRIAWESKDTKKYLDFYSPAFRAQGMTYTQWIEQKRQASDRKSWRKVAFSNMGIVLYPGYERLAEVTFLQDYQSSEFNHKMRKRQYWYLNQGHWKIMYEGIM
ncbi:MAG: L,D-transpeptidase family protein [Pseudomonadota bacterium]